MGFEQYEPGQQAKDMQKKIDSEQQLVKEKLENKTPEQTPEQTSEQTSEQIKAFEKIKKSFQQKFHCSESEATVFLIRNQETIGNIYDAKTVEEYLNKYLNKPETEKQFNKFRIDFKKFHETSEG